MRDDIARRAKHQELLRAARDGADRVGGTARIDAEGVAAAFAEITAPEIGDDFTAPDIRTGLVVIGISDIPQATSRKPGNLILDWRKLTDVVPDVAMAAAAAITGPPWVGFIVALYIWTRFWRDAEVPLGEAEASVLYALWKHRGGENRIAEETGYAKANGVRQAFGLDPLTRSAYARAIDALLRIECIAIVGGVIQLRESVRIRYS